MEDSIKKYIEGNLTKDELSSIFFQLMFSTPRPNLKNGKMVQEPFTKHPISKAMGQIQKYSKHKKAIAQCITFSKDWWKKTTDTYLFPTYALTLFLEDSSPTAKYFMLIDEKKSKEIYDFMSRQLDLEDLFTKTIVASDQHTTLGEMNGIGRKSVYSKPTFVLYHSAVRPYTISKEQTSLDYIKLSLPNLPEKYQQQAYRNLIEFGKGEMSEKKLWEKQELIMSEGLNIPPIPHPFYWKGLDTKRGTMKSEINIYHPDERCSFPSHPYTPLIDGWRYDTLISLVQKSIRRSNLYNALWAACRILMFGMFHQKVTPVFGTTLWSIYKGGLAKITNLINRLHVIVAEDFFPCAKLFTGACSILEKATKTKKLLKEPQEPELYQKRFDLIVKLILSLVTSIVVNYPKQHYVGVVMCKNKHYYEEARRNLINKRKRDE